MRGLTGFASIESIGGGVVRMALTSGATEELGELIAEAPESFGLDHESMVLNLNLTYWLGKEVFTDVAGFRMMIDGMGVDSHMMTISEAERQENNALDKPEGLYVIMHLGGDALAEMLIGIAAGAANAKFGTMTIPRTGETAHIVVFTPASLRAPEVDGSDIIQ
jgi:hypothetical protein